MDSSLHAPSSSLTIAYVTARKNSKIEWFLESLERQALGDKVDLIVVDGSGIRPSISYPDTNHGCFARVTFTNPKPNVWNGPHRLTKQDWFAMASARNTALCLCQTSHLAYVDDLSVLMPGWLDAVREAVAGNYIGCGAYKKVKNLQVQNGVPTYDEFPQGVDDRLKRVTQDVSPCDGGWLFGCSCVFPIEALLTVGGWPEFVDGLGAEDYTLGIALENAGFQLKYDRRMLTLESEELHFIEPPMRKTDKGVSPNDKSHAALAIAKGSKYFANYYEGGIRALRDHVLAGNPFPIVKIPDTDWFDAQPLKQMD